MKHLIKAISFSIGFAFCASPVMAQIPKIPKVNVPKIGKDKKDTPNTNTNTKSTTNGGKSIDEYNAAMKEGYALKSALNYTAAIPFFEKAANVAPTSATQPYERDARNQVTFCKEKEAKCKENLTKMNDLAAAKNYNEISGILNRFCDAPPASGAGCDCLISTVELSKFKNAVDGDKNRKEELNTQIYAANAAYTNTMRTLTQSRDALNRLDVVEGLYKNIAAANHKQLKDEAIKYGLESTYNSAESEYQKVLAFFTGEDKYLRKELDDAYANIKSAKPATSWLLEKFTILSRYCDMALIINPSSTVHKEAKAEALKYKEMTLQKMRDSGVFSSKFHEENVYKVIFSDKPFVAGKESQNTIKTKFSLNDKIYGMAYFDERKSEPMLLTFDLGSEKYIKSNTHRQDAGGQGYYAFEVIPDVATGWTRLAYHITGDLMKLTPRKYNINVSINKAIGTLEIDATTGQEHVEKVNKAIYEKRVDMNRMEKPVATDATAIEQATKLFSGTAYPEQKVQVLRVVVLNKAWTTYYDPNYIVKTIAHRAIDVEIGYKDLKTGKCYCEGHVVSQNHNGKVFTNYEVSGHPDMDNEIRCENINK